MIHHIQLACPAGSEDTLREFYGGLLGLAEKPKPPVLATRGGCRVEGVRIELHLGVEADFPPAPQAAARPSPADPHRPPARAPASGDAGGSGAGLPAYPRG